jgi:hypothetical protein
MAGVPWGVLRWFRTIRWIVGARMSETALHGMLLPLSGEVCAICTQCTQLKRLFQLPSKCSCVGCVEMCLGLLGLGFLAQGHSSIL